MNQSLFQFDGNTLTAWWVIVIVAIFLFYVFRLLIVTLRIIRKLELQFSPHIYGVVVKE